LIKNDMRSHILTIKKNKIDFQVININYLI